MIFNNIINHLKRWCLNKAEIYQKSCGEYGGVTHVGYQVAYELEFKLSTLIDKSFESVGDLKTEILNFIDVHYEPSVLKPQNDLAKHIIQKTNLIYNTLKTLKQYYNYTFKIFISISIIFKTGIL